MKSSPYFFPEIDDFAKLQKTLVATSQEVSGKKVPLFGFILNVSEESLPFHVVEDPSPCSG